jgi:ribosomal protein S18 acetylase RimI-like enzyme
MGAVEFNRFRLRLVSQYAADQVRVGNWTAEQAEFLAAHEVDALLPDGVATAGMLLLAAETAGDGLIGYAWVAVERPGSSGAWLYDIWVAPEHRGNGHGRALLSIVELEVARLGSCSLGLNVFADNEVARRLYGSSLYEVASVQMRKALVPPVLGPSEHSPAASHTPPEPAPGEC